jgi:hypothetical protein
MAYNKKDTTLGADIPTELSEAFDKQRKERMQVKKGAMIAAIKLWVSLPAAIQARLMDQTLSEIAFVELVEEIVDNRIKKLTKVDKK